MGSLVGTGSRKRGHGPRGGRIVMFPSTQVCGKVIQASTIGAAHLTDFPLMSGSLSRGGPVPWPRRAP
jgi:hypothetical protein